MSVGIILCARTKSERFPDKILQKLGGKTWIERGVENLMRSEYPLVICPPKGEWELLELLRPYSKTGKVVCYDGTDTEDEDVLGRMVKNAELFGFEHVVRVTHDDCVFCDIPLMEAMVDWHLKNGADHTNCPQAPRGTDCEVISVSALKLAAEHTKHLKRREHITYYVKRPPFKWQEFLLDYRVALDWKEDWDVIESAWNSDLPLRNHFLAHPEAVFANRIPKVSVYICCRDYGKYLRRAIDSVLAQAFKGFELIVVDDGSKDDTRRIMDDYEKVKKITHEISKGLAASSNEAVHASRGEYILRLDADDWLEPEALAVMVGYLDNSPDRAMVYSDYTMRFDYLGTQTIISQGEKDLPHPACCLIRRNAWNNIRYDEGLICRDGLDFYLKFKSCFGVGYLPMPLWNYFRHADTLSRKAEALETERKILDGFVEARRNGES